MAVSEQQAGSNNTMNVRSVQAHAWLRCLGWLLLQAAINCYAGDADSKLIQDSKSQEALPAPELTAALNYFNIPSKLRPPGLRIQNQINLKRQAYADHLERLLVECTDVSYLAGSMLLHLLLACTNHLCMQACRHAYEMD